MDPVEEFLRAPAAASHSPLTPTTSSSLPIQYHTATSAPPLSPLGLMSSAGGSAETSSGSHSSAGSAMMPGTSLLFVVLLASAILLAVLGFTCFMIWWGRPWDRGGSGGSGSARWALLAAAAPRQATAADGAPARSFGLFGPAAAAGDGRRPWRQRGPQVARGGGGGAGAAGDMPWDEESSHAELQLNEDEGAGQLATRGRGAPLTVFVVGLPVDHEAVSGKEGGIKMMSDHHRYPVLMPGQNVPTFIACPIPSRTRPSLRDENRVVDVEGKNGDAT